MHCNPFQNQHYLDMVHASMTLGQRVALHAHCLWYAAARICDAKSVASARLPYKTLPNVSQSDQCNLGTYQHLPECPQNVQLRSQMHDAESRQICCHDRHSHGGGLDGRCGSILTTWTRENFPKSKCNTSKHLTSENHNEHLLHECQTQEFGWSSSNKFTLSVFAEMQSWITKLLQISRV